jgi:hypothetical protein
MLDEREKRWRQKARERGRKQIAVWLDGQTYEALQEIVEGNKLRGMGEAIRLLVHTRQTAQKTPQSAPKRTGWKTSTTPAPAHERVLERQPDLERCECKTARGRGGAAAGTRPWRLSRSSPVRVSASSGPVKRHKLNFAPWLVN